MIIRRDRKDFLFITQPDHARLAAEIIAHWRTDGFPDNPRRDSILLAAREHDNGWIEEDEMTHVDAAGEPLDFVATPVPVKHRIWPRAAARLAEVDGYAAALVAHHAIALHGQQLSDPLWRGFLAKMERIEADLLAAGSPERAALPTGNPERAALLHEDYRFVQVADQLSLVFCNAWTAPFPRPGGRTILKGTTLEITPDPFGGERVPIRVRARRTPARTFASAADLRATLDTAAVEILEGTAVGQS
jgi:hypothetical protein